MSAQSTQTAHVRCAGSRHIAASPDDVFSLLTPEGERSWVDGWAPIYPALATPTEAPGTVFLTDHHGAESVWIIVEKDDGNRRAAYAYVLPQVRAVLVQVSCSNDGDGTSASIVYDMTALAPEHDDDVRAFADGFEAMLDEWQRRMSDQLAGAVLTA